MEDQEYKELEKSKVYKVSDFAGSILALSLKRTNSATETIASLCMARQR
jgi:hypothetical protein